MFFNERFRKNWAAVAVVGTIATISCIFLCYQVRDLLSERTASSSISQGASTSPYGGRPDGSSGASLGTVQSNAPGVAPAPNAKTIELEFWKSVSRTDNVAGYQEYLDRYPSGEFASIARNRINQFNLASQSQQGTQTGESQKPSQSAASDNSGISAPGKKCIVLFTGERVCSDK